MYYEDLIGIPFKDGGRGKDGIDCWGLVMLLLKRQGYRNIRNYDISAFSMREINDEIEKERNSWRKISNPRYGCVVLIANGCTSDANHVGIVVDNNKFIHCYAYSGVCLSSLKRWRGHILGYYLPPEGVKNSDTDSDGNKPV